MRENIEIGDRVVRRGSAARAVVVGLDALLQWEDAPPPGVELTVEGFSSSPIEDLARMIPMSEVHAEAVAQSIELGDRLAVLRRLVQLVESDAIRGSGWATTAAAVRAATQLAELLPTTTGEIARKILAAIDLLLAALKAEGVIS